MIPGLALTQISFSILKYKFYTLCIPSVPKIFLFYDKNDQPHQFKGA